MSIERFQFVRQLEPSAEERTAITDILNEQHADLGLKWAPLPVSVLIKDDDGAVIGGLTGSTNWGWLHVDLLAVSQDLRGAGAGTKLLLAAEEIARERGCRFSYLDTFSFQALGFYEKHDYEVYGVLDDFPTGAQRYFLKKKL